MGQYVPVRTGLGLPARQFEVRRWRHRSLSWASLRMSLVNSVHIKYSGFFLVTSTYKFSSLIEGLRCWSCNSQLCSGNSQHEQRSIIAEISAAVCGDLLHN